MSAVIRRFRSGPDRLRDDEAQALRQALLPFMDDPAARPQVGRALCKLLAVLDGETASSNGWTFLMLSPAQNDAVVRFLAAHSIRPLVAVQLWSFCFRHLLAETGEIMVSRSEIAEHLGVAPRDVSRVVSELVAFGALIRRRDGRGVRYFMNHRVATHLAGKARDDAQASSPVVGGGAVLRVIDGTSHPSQRRERAAVPPVEVL